MSLLLLGCGLPTDGGAPWTPASISGLLAAPIIRDCVSASKIWSDTINGTPAVVGGPVGAFSDPWVPGLNYTIADDTDPATFPTLQQSGSKYWLQGDPLGDDSGLSYVATITFTQPYWCSMAVQLADVAANHNVWGTVLGGTSTTQVGNITSRWAMNFGTNKQSALGVATTAAPHRIDQIINGTSGGTLTIDGGSNVIAAGSIGTRNGDTLTLMSGGITGFNGKFYGGIWAPGTTLNTSAQAYISALFA